jgi:hypothetical protein
MRVTCPFCQRELARKEVEMWGSFTCPQCHKMIRIRSNYTVRILRLALIAGVGIFLTDWFRLHVPVILVFLGVGLIDEFVMRLLPAKIEPAGGLIA